MNKVVHQEKSKIKITRKQELEAWRSAGRGIKWDKETKRSLGRRRR